MGVSGRSSGVPWFAALARMVEASVLHGCSKKNFIDPLPPAKRYYRRNKVLQPMTQKVATVESGIVATGEIKSWNQRREKLLPTGKNVGTNESKIGARG